MRWRSIFLSISVAACIGHTANAQCGVELIDYLDTSANAITVDALGDIVAVGLGNSGIDFVDASDPSSLALLSTINPGINARRVALVSGYAVAADGNSTLRVIDLSTPTAPVQAGTLDIPGGVSSEFGDLDASGNLAVLSTPSGGVSIVDFSDPAAPVLSSSINPTGYSPRAVSLEGTVLAVADGSTVRLYDLSDPTQPASQGALPYSQNITDLLIDGDMLFVSRNGGPVIDISDPSDPVQIATSGAVSGRLAGGAHRLYALDFEELRTNVPDAGMNSWTGYDYRLIDFSDPRDIAGSGNRAYIAGGFAGLIAFDASNPEGGARTRSRTSDSAEPTSIAATPSVLASVNNRFDPGNLRFYDISDPDATISPWISGRYDNSYVSAAAKGNIIYAAYEAYDFPKGPSVDEPGILIISAADPNSISDIGSIDIGARQLHVDGDDLYARGGNTVWQYDVTDPAAPLLVVSGTVPGLGAVDDAMTAKNGYIFVGGADGTVSIVDMQAVGGPSLLSQTPVGFAVDSLSANDHLIAAFVGSKDGGSSELTIIDYTDPIDPSPFTLSLGEQFPQAPQYVFGVLNGDVLYITDFFGGIHCYSLADPMNPILFNVGDDFGNYIGTIAFFNNTIFAGGFLINVIDPPSCIPSTPDCPGDVTGDGEVNLADLNLVLANFGQTTSVGDATGDNQVNLADLNAVLAAFGQACP